jgi:hypothetical protein
MACPLCINEMLGSPLLDDSDRQQAMKWNVTVWSLMHSSPPYEIEILSHVGYISHFWWRWREKAVDVVCHTCIAVCSVVCCSGSVVLQRIHCRGRPESPLVSFMHFFELLACMEDLIKGGGLRLGVDMCDS